MVNLKDYIKYLGKQGHHLQSEKDNISYPEYGHENKASRETNSFWFTHRNAFVLQLLRLFPIRWLLDVGGGTGFLTAYLQQNGVEVVLLDPQEKAIKIAEERGIQQKLHGTLKSIGFLEGSLPAISIFDVLEHIENDQEHLDDCYALLEPGGYLFITVPAYPWLWSKFDEIVGHYRRYTIKKLTKMVRKAGFEVQISGYFFYILPIIIYLARVLIPKVFRNQPNDGRWRNHNQSGWKGTLLKFALKLEVYLLKRRICMPFGSSCFLVAKKIKT